VTDRTEQTGGEPRHGTNLILKIMDTSIFFGRYKTEDGRTLRGFINDYGEWVIILGNLGVFKFNCEKKATNKMHYFIKELNAVEI